MILENSINSWGVHTITTFKYNSDNQLTLETYETDRKKTEKTFIYNDLIQLINIIYKFTDYDSNGQVIDTSESEAPREYEINRLVKEWWIWGGFTTYEYNDNKVVTKIDYTKNGVKHHITVLSHL